MSLTNVNWSPKKRLRNFRSRKRERKERGSEIIEASTETNEMKQQLEISDKTEKIFISESEDSTRPLQNLLPATYSIEQQ
jgi:hypothetical protein